ncbi:hypothetical protein AYL99_11050 [Fonsecaea erecta]|uniref:Mid2 domain-containing protein n=1 Tax=Fonsecaea erecta TaxID=1367422 RepID=A0A178Z4E5_9EURO|nr:hypothetical protein AYL99_11050 [Fonsecaea erecta]OAP54602.1 hypothetical protein AYL99_11050 [Fonsecaea erecta]
MAEITASVTTSQRATAKAIPVSPITSAPILTHRRDLLKRADTDTVDDNTCGWVNGDLNTPLVCDYQACLWSPELHAVGCCADAYTTDCAWVTSCVPYSMVNNGCDMACQGNYLNTVCGEDYPLCATATFGGPAGYTYLSCTDTIGTTDTMMLTYYGGNATIDNLPRYFSSYWYGSTATSTSSSTSSSSPGDDADTDDTISWVSAHRTILIGAIAGFCGLVFLFLVGCCILRAKRSNRGRYAPASQQLPPQEGYGMHYQRAAAYQRPPSYPSPSGYGYQQEYNQVYVVPNK